MKRKAQNIDEEESRLSSLLFNKSKKFAETLPTPNKSESDVDVKPVWIDEDDETLKANVIQKVTSDGLYVQKLKQKYETLIGTPSWAKIDHVKDENKELQKDDLLRSVGHLKKNIINSLKKDVLEVKTFPKVNSETNEGTIISNVEFHPKLSVALVAGQSGVVSLYSIGSETNNKLHSFKLGKWKLTAAQFTPDGSEAYLASKLSHEYCVYNLVKAEPQLLQLPRIVKRPKVFVLSPDGKLIVTSDGLDEVYIICSHSKELLKCLKHNNNVESLTFSPDSLQLYSYGVQGEITVWDMLTYRALKKFYDHGCVTASCIVTSPCGNLIATGSGEGIVNVYNTAKIITKEPLPHKTISNLSTKITNLRFNATTEILSIASSYYPNALKLIHIPSYHVFCNFPKQNLCQVQTVNFSPNSGYMALGNNKGSAYLYRLKHYKNY